MGYTINTKKTWHQTQSELAYEFEKWGVVQWDTNYPRGARLEGQNQSVEDRTVTLKYKKRGKDITITMGKQSRAVDNLRVLYLAIESMRLNEKRGISEVLESAYLQLVAPEVFDPYKILGIFEGSTLEVCEVVYKAKVMTAHPDKGGSAEEMKKLNKAIEMIRKEKNR